MGFPGFIEAASGATVIGMPKSMRARAVRVGVAMLLLVGGLTAAVSQSAAAATCTSGVPGDVNGDGYAEVAVGEPRGAARETGAVHVFYGQPSGLVADPRGTALDDQHVTLVRAGGLEPGAPPRKPRTTASVRPSRSATSTATAARI